MNSWVKTFKPPPSVKLYKYDHMYLLLLIIGVDFKIKILDAKSNAPRVKLTIWDTAGQERFRSLTSSYYRGAQGVILVYDVTSRESFDNLRGTWLKELETYADLDDLVLMVVGNKVDLEAERQVSLEDGRQFSKNISALFMESSAKTKIGVKAIFDELVRKILNSPIMTREKDKEQAIAQRNKVSLQKDDDEFGEQETGCSC